MRLTLRTMLAYLDDVLEPADAEELREKIEGSKVATTLVHRIRTSVGRMRLGSPKVLGQGVGADPNTVAEYLDNTLPADRVPEMEKVCLESDMHLAEVAGCHQILTLVLGEPAQVESGLRERVYRLANLPVEQLQLPVAEHLRIDQVVAEQNAPAAPNAPQAVVNRESSRVPDYLREDRARRPLPIFIALLLGFLITAGALLVFDSQVGIARFLGISREDSVVQSDGATQGRQSHSAALGTDDATVSGASENNGLADNDDAIEAGDPRETVVAPVDPGVDEQANAAQLSDVLDATVEPAEVERPIGDRFEATNDQWEPDTLAPTPAPADAAMPSDDVWQPEPSGVDPIVPLVSRDTTTNDSAEDTTTAGDGEMPDPTGESETAAADGNRVPPDAGDEISAADRLPRVEPEGPLAPGDPTVTNDQPITDSGGNSLADAEDTAAPLQVGRALSDNQVLAYQDDITGNWYRVPGRGALTVGQRLRVMPTYRPQFLLIPSAIQVTLVGGSTLSIVEMLEPNTPTFSATSARLLLAPYQQAGGQVAFVVGEQQILMSLDDLNTTVAVQIENVFPPGRDPRSEPRVPVTRIWVMGGHVRLETNLHPVQEITDGQQFVLVENRPGQIVPDVGPPAWMDSKSTSDIDRAAAAELEMKMRDGRPLALVLTENLEHRKVDVQSLAARCLASLGHFDELAASFRNDSLYSAWHYHVDEMKAALSRGPAVAEAVGAAFDRVYGDAGPALFRMLWGYDTAQLRDQAAQQLVDYLESDRVEFRVLAFEDLRRITGANLLYQPHYPEARRKQSVARWRERLAAGQIVYDREPQWVPVFPQAE